MKHLLATLALAAAALAAGACSATNAGDAGSPAASAGAPDPDAPTITAKDLRFGQSEVVVPAGRAFTLTFVNEESAPHNVAIYADEAASQNLFRGEIFSSGTRSAQVPALAAGRYLFRCDVHPDMRGTIVAR